MFFTGYLSSTGTRCLLGLAPDYMYLRVLCYPTPGTRGCSSLRSMEREIIFVPFSRTSTRQTHAFSMVGAFVWNGILLHCDFFTGFTPTHSILALKLLFLAVLESGALLSSNLKGALYKSM